MLEQRTQQRLADYLTVGEAADFLGVSPWTLRNWDKAGRLKAIRHPKNGYRIYRQQDLEAVLDPGDVFAPTGRSQNRIDWTQMGDREHFVQFYEDDAFLVDSVAGYLNAGLERGQGAVVIATREHRVAIGKKLKAQGMNLAAGKASGKYVALDAAETLSRFMVNGMPDAQLFMRVVGRVVSHAMEGQKGLRAFGEMVALLWKDGNKAAAIHLEELWNDLAKIHAFALFCAYPMSAFAGDNQADLMRDVCTCHTRVIPAESYASLASPEARLRAIALLQQKAQSLAAEIEHRKEVEEQLRAAKAAAEETNRAKDEFLAVLSHELRTPLTPVLISTAMMESDPGLPPRLREDLAMIRRNVALETQLIDDLLDISRVINGKMVLHKRDLDIHPLLKNVLEMVGEDARQKQIHIDLDLKAAGDRVHGDSARLHQVIWNVLKNAIKFTPEGGRVSICTKNEAGRLIIEVQDSGIGIDPRDLSMVFDAFEQGRQGVAPRMGGLGLGLAISRTIMEMHQGTIAAESDGKGCGALFSIGLSTIAPADQPLEETDTASDDVAKEAHPVRILLVDDHVDTLRVLRRILESDGHSVTSAGSVQEATRAACNNGFDLLISDIGLPDGTGMDVVQAVREKHPKLPAIAMTGFGMPQDIRESEAAGFTMHLTKPVDVNSLEAAIRVLTSGSD